MSDSTFSLNSRIPCWEMCGAKVKIAWIFCLGCVFVLTMAACQPVQYSSVTYQDLCGLTSEQFGKMDERDVRQWIQSKKQQPFQAPIPDLPGEIKADQIQAYGWMQSANKNSYGVAYLRKGRLVRISMPDFGKEISFGQVVAELGMPSTVYRSALQYEQVLYTIGIDYPTLGVTVYTTGHEDRNNLMHEDYLAIYLTSAMPVWRVECYQPDSMETVLRESFFQSTESTLLEMQRRAPWPGFNTWIPF